MTREAPALDSMAAEAAGHTFAVSDTALLPAGHTDKLVAGLHKAHVRGAQGSDVVHPADNHLADIHRADTLAGCSHTGGPVLARV